MTDEFAARRRVMQDDAIATLLPQVRDFIDQGVSAAPELAEVMTQLYIDTYLSEGGDRRARTAGFIHSMRSVLVHTEPDSDPTTVATWLAVAAINAATVQAASDDPAPTLLKWTTMHDTNVREAHAAADRQRRPAGAYFHVGGENLRYPGDPRGRIENTINCRCILQPVPVNQVALLAAMKENAMPLESPLAWHGVLAPEDEWSGDGRRFAAGALRNRDLPLPLTWQRASGEGHDGSVVVARIDSIERIDNMIHGEGVFIDTPETDEVVGLIAEFGKFGVSIDADDSEFEFDEEENKVTFTSARIASASLVSIPAFASAYVALGTWADANKPFPPKNDAPPEEDPECDPESPDYEDCLAKKAQEKGLDAPPEAAWVKVDPSPDGEQVPVSAGLATGGAVVEMISEESWDGSAGRFTPEQWKKSTILHVCDGLEKSCHKLPIREPGGALSRAGVHAAASRFNQVDAPAEAKASAARQLRGAYKQLGEEVPDVLKASNSTDEFGRGPGWLTNPEDTRRIWAYWTQPCHEGYAKINWGVPGDFSRCRVLVGEEIGENSPDKLRFINQICAQWHHDATGFWPGHAPAELRVETDTIGHACETCTAVRKILVKGGPEGAGRVLALDGSQGNFTTRPEGSVWSALASGRATVGGAPSGVGGTGRPDTAGDDSGPRLQGAIVYELSSLGAGHTSGEHQAAVGRARARLGLPQGSPQDGKDEEAAVRRYLGGVRPLPNLPSRGRSAPALSLVASGGQGHKAPAAWFTDPKLSGPTHLTVTDEGRVFGHIASWSVCHIGYDGVCVAPPSSASGYAYFATGRVQLDNGGQAQTGVISLGGGHAGSRMGFRAAAAHYDSTSTAVADVSVGEDEHGIWCAGWVRPGVDDNTVTALLASDVSGDWREIGGQMEMIAALAVNVAGFPIAAVHNKSQVTLVAAGVVHHEEDALAALIAKASEYAVAAAFERRAKMARLRERVGT